MTLTKKTTHASEALSEFVQQFKDKPNLAALMNAYTEQVQDIENALFELIDERTIETAVGVQLDGLGSIVGENRRGADDDDYRLRIRARILINISSGTPEQILEILRLIITNNYSLAERYPAAFEIEIDDELTETPSEVARAVNEARPAAVNTTVLYTLASDAVTFHTATGDTVETSSDQGFSYEVDGTWTGSTAYVVGQIVTNDDAGTDRDYVCVTSGTSAGSGGPTGTGSGITDGTVVWDYLADNADPKNIGGVFADAEAA